MKIALAQIDVTIGRTDSIEASIRRAWERARDAGADLLVLPELATTGYPPQDLLRDRGFVQRSLELLERLRGMTASGGPGLLLGYCEPNYDGPGNDLWNSAALLDGGEHVGTARKTLLPTYDVFDEDRYFEPSRDRRLLPFRGTQLGVTICEDIWASPELWNKDRYPVDPCAELAELGAEVLINISASPWSVGRAAVRRDLVGATARATGRYTVYCNQVGAHDELIFDGHSIVADPQGRVVFRLADFEEDFGVLKIPTGAAPSPAPAVDLSPELDWREEIRAALCLGVRDYVRKTGHSDVLVGLSGGIDSALTAALAADALGPEHVWGIGMPTRYSSDHSLDDARELAENLGIRFDVLSVDASFQALLDQLAPTFEGTPPGIAEENLQARVRGTTLMALSNKFGHLVLATSNKSEMAVGYSTLYGDMCGALAVLGDLSKTRVWEVSCWLNRDGVRIPTRSIEKPPSAELRPDQRDDDSLPPYALLDAIVDHYVEHARPAAVIAKDLGAEEPLVREILKMVQRAEYKRRQAAPVLRVTTKAFGIGRRMPIVARP